MNCYNGEKYLKQALDSIFDQTYKDFEVVFIDNCSIDKSIEIAQSYGDKVKIYKTPENMSLCRARVFAKGFIHGDFFCVLDVDDIWKPTKLEKQVKIMEQNPDVGAIYTNTIYFTNDSEGSLAYNSLMPSGNIFKEMLASYFLSLETIMLRKDIMDKHNLYFSEKYNVSSDMELFTKLSYFTKFYYLDEPLAMWRYGHANESAIQFESFSNEYEQLLVDLRILIPNFDDNYSDSSQKLNGVIYNMKGICAWKNEKRSSANQFFKKAFYMNKKYIIPYFFSFFLKYESYEKLRSLNKTI
jgi:glycosyltransferase involved in cell wall biosynthesis